MFPAMFEEAVPTLMRSAELLALLLLPIYAWAGGRRLLRVLDSDGYAAVPGLARFSFVSGAVTGALLLAVCRDPSAYALDTVLTPLGPWGVPFDELFTVWLDPRAYAPAPLWQRVRGLDPQDPVTAFAVLAALLAALVVAGALRGFGRRAPRALLLSALVWLGGAVLAVYAVCAGAWAVHILSLWAVAVVILLVRWHTWRHRVG
jgi:hypothetical protein